MANVNLIHIYLYRKLQNACTPDSKKSMEKLKFILSSDFLLGSANAEGNTTDISLWNRTSPERTTGALKCTLFTLMAPPNVTATGCPHNRKRCCQQQKVYQSTRNTSAPTAAHSSASSSTVHSTHGHPPAPKHAPHMAHLHTQRRHCTRNFKAHASNASKSTTLTESKNPNNS